MCVRVGYWSSVWTTLASLLLNCQQLRWIQSLSSPTSVGWKGKVREELLQTICFSGNWPWPLTRDIQPVPTSTRHCATTPGNWGQQSWCHVIQYRCWMSGDELSVTALASRFGSFSSKQKAHTDILEGFRPVKLSLQSLCLDWLQLVCGDETTKLIFSLRRRSSRRTNNKAPSGPY